MKGSIVCASSLVENVLDFARGKLGDEIVLTVDASNPVGPAIDHVVAELRAVYPERSIRADIDIADAIDADGQRIGQLASNLLANALTHGAADQPVSLIALTSDAIFELSVANHGEPIPEGVLASIFEPFVKGGTRRNKGGLGLGLHIATQIAKAHGGTLTVCSEAREARFTFRMPLRRKGCAEDG